ncbi:ricin-type beta-trefoil lectin domain protein [Kitasatospora sp. NBC_00070]|uniref:ricin-type beta-trefoil lectin domain protein n=1 Tax=Kitasatospora sp. NBC_00070 TaxID=2975962 RepID=UPI0032470A6D
MGAIPRRWPGRRSAALTGLVSLSLSVGLLGAAPAALAADPKGAADHTTAPDRPVSARERAESAAQAEAKRTGKPVPVPALTTETDTVVANPDGSFALSRSVAPVRTRQGDRWAELDATLGKSADGLLRPRATGSALALSGGGNAPLATLEQDGKKIVLSWPEALPVPTVEGDTATYREVAPGTDLKLTADQAGGISQVLVVKSAEAARSPKLAKLTMGLKSQGVSVAADQHGNLKATDEAGRLVFHAPSPTMWDSSTSAPAAPAARALKSAPLSAAPAAGANAAAAKPTSDEDGPGGQAKVSRLKTDLGAGTVALTPDAGFLADPKTTYPVFIDPAWQPTNRGTQHWAWVQEGYPNTVNYDAYSASYDPGVGYQQWQTAKGLERYYVQLDTGDLRDKSIKKASLYATQSYAADATCTNNRGVVLHATDTLGAGTTWNSQPWDWGAIGTSWMNSSGGNGCPGTTTRGEWDVRQHLADNEWRGNLTFALFSADESKTGGNYSFKRFTRDRNNLPFLYIEYNRAPYDPWSLAINPAPQNANGNGCGWIGATNAATGIQFSAWIGDPDNQTNDTHFVVHDTTAGEPVAWDSGWIASAGGTHWASATTTSLQDGHRYYWKAQGGDGDRISANWSFGCMFSLDTTPPSVPVVTSAEYPPAGTLPGSSKFIGQPGAFTVRSADASSGVLFYEYAFNGNIPVGSAQRVDATGDGSAAINLTPTTWGTNVLRVQAVDRAGNRSQQQTYTFYAPDNPAAKTVLGDITGDERVDLLAPTPGGDLVVYPTASDPAAGVTASDKANSPGGKGWNGTLVTHRGGNGIRYDDLFAYRDKALYLYRNSLTQGGLAANANLYFASAKQLPVGRPDPQDCLVQATGAPCGDEYAADWSRVRQILAVGDARKEAGDPRNDLITVETDGKGRTQLILFQGSGATGTLRDPIVLGSAGWDGLTLIAPGDATGDGLPDLWARDDSTGDVYQYANAADVAALGDHSRRTRIAQQLKATDYPVLSSSGDTSADTVADLWALDSRQRLVTLNGTATGKVVTGFGTANTVGDARISRSHWNLNEGTGSTAGDLRRRTDATLGAGAGWTDATVAGTATKVLDLDGRTGVATTSAPVVDTSHSFTVSTWARVDTPGGVIVSQDGAHASGFVLWAEGGDSTWRFGMSQRDNEDWSYDQTLTMNAAAAIQVGTWTQLTATYDQPTGQLALYVNGTLAGTGYHARELAWNATGPLAVGRYRYQSKPSTTFDGAVSNLSVLDYSSVPTAARTSLVSGVSEAKCLDDNASGTDNGTAIQIWDCNPSTAQQFEIRGDGTLRVLGKCLDVQGNGTVNGSPVALWDCKDPAGSDAGNQQWLPRANGALLNPQSGRCLDLPDGNIGNGTRVTLYDCNGSNPQRWSAAGLGSPAAARAGGS